jgi:hypothetical protein
MASYIFPHHMIVLSDSLGDYDVDCRHTDVSLFVRISILQYVRHSLPLPSLRVYFVLTLHGSSQKPLPTNGPTALDTDDTSTVNSQDEKTLVYPLGPTVDPVCEQV